MTFPVRRYLCFIGIILTLILKFWSWQWHLIDAIVGIFDWIFIIPILLYILTALVGKYSKLKIAPNIELVGMLVSVSVFNLYMLLTPDLSTLLAKAIFWFCLLSCMGLTVTMIMFWRFEQREKIKNQ